jgi:hypothetical protein
MRTFTGIQAMRGVAALSVAVCHLLITRFAYDAEPGFINALIGVLRTGVDLFFVISGFVIALAAAEIGKAEGRHGTLNFAFRRCARIYPLYWIVLAAAVLSSLVITLQGWPDIPQTLTASYVFLTVDWNWFIPQAWSLAFEVYFYLAVAIVLLIVPNRVIEALVLAVCVLVLLDLSPLPRAPDVCIRAQTSHAGIWLWRLHRLSNDAQFRARLACKPCDGCGVLRGRNLSGRIGGVDQWLSEGRYFRRRVCITDLQRCGSRTERRKLSRLAALSRRHFLFALRLASFDLGVAVVIRRPSLARCSRDADVACGDLGDLGCII